MPRIDFLRALLSMIPNTYLVWYKIYMHHYFAFMPPQKKAKGINNVINLQLHLKMLLTWIFCNGSRKRWSQFQRRLNFRVLIQQDN